MIAQILNREFILQQLDDVQKVLPSLQADLQQPAPQRKELLGLDERSIVSLQEETAAAVERERKESSGQQGDASELRAGAAPIDDFSFISCDPLISNLQSALESYFIEEEQGRRVVDSGVQDDNRRGGRVPSVTDQSIARWQPRRTNEGRRLFNKFSTLDAGWVACKTAERWRARNGPHHFVPEPKGSLKVTDRVRLILVGDWATGIPRARQVTAAIRAELDQGKREGREQHVIHLGDTYYAGWGEEYQRRFLPYWPVDDWEADSIGSWSLNGNHDMYSGGHGYYEVLLQDRRFRRQNGSSVFSLHNDNWQILGLDTAYYDHDLKDQTGWIREQIDRSNRKMVFLSHHQLFSAYEKGGPKLEEKLAGILATDRVRVWFWGHEHRCVFYKPYQHVEFARCVGHGGVPVYMWHGANAKYPAPAFYEYRDRLPRKLEPWAYMGFAVLDFEGPNINVRYINENGRRHYNPKAACDEQLS